MAPITETIRVSHRNEITTPRETTDALEEPAAVVADDRQPLEPAKFVLSTRDEVRGVATRLQSLGYKLQQAILDIHLNDGSHPIYTSFPERLQHLTLKVHTIHDCHIRMIAGTLPNLVTLRIITPSDPSHQTLVTPGCLTWLATGCKSLKVLQLPLRFQAPPWRSRPFMRVERLIMHRIQVPTPDTISQCLHFLAECFPLVDAAGFELRQGIIDKVTLEERKKRLDFFPSFQDILDEREVLDILFRPEEKRGEQDRDSDDSNSDTNSVTAERSRSLSPP